MKIFQVMVDDRHTDTEAIPFSTSEKALAYAKQLFEAYCDEQDEPDDNEEMGIQPTSGGWLFYAVYSTEGDCIWVVEQELDGEGSIGGTSEGTSS